MIFKNYEYFLAIAEEGNLTRAAEKLFISQPSLSQYLKRLESNLGQELFDRHSNPLRLTYTGQRYYEYVKQLVRLDDNLRREFQDINSGESGTIELGITIWRAACFLPDIFPAFHAQYPGIRFKLTEKPGSELLSYVAAGKVDMAVMNTPDNLDYSGLICDNLYRERLLLAVPSEWEQAKRATESSRRIDGMAVMPFKELESMPLIASMPGQHIQACVEHALAKNHIQADVLMNTGNTTTAINLAARGMGCVFVPGEGAKVCQHPGKITYFVIDCPELIWDLSAVYRKDTYLPRLCRLLIDSARDQLNPRQTGYC